MSKKWYCIPHTNEVGSYNVDGELTDFPRGVLLAYRDCCLATGFDSKEAAEDWMKTHPCKEQNNV